MALPLIVSNKKPLSASGLPVPLAYHDRTQHHLQRYADGPESLDWEAQPDPFRCYSPVEIRRLPWLDETQHTHSGYLRQTPQQCGGNRSPAPADQASLGTLLALSLGLSAWKSLGGDKWALRINPSSGNLHPVEAYLVVLGGFSLAPGVYHYRPDIHSLECRAEFSVAPTPTPRAFVALTTVVWREVWKYGERAFRYCQLDVGHAHAALSTAAHVLGWSLVEHAVGHRDLSRLLGVDRASDFPTGRRVNTSHEEAEILLELLIRPFEENRQEAGRASAVLNELSSSAVFFGRANEIDRYPLYAWPVIDEILAATRAPESSQAHERPPISPSPSPRAPTSTRARTSAPVNTSTAAKTASLEDPTPSGAHTVASLILGRRSAQRFNPKSVMERGAFWRVLQAVSTRGWAPLPSEQTFDLVFWLHRVRGYDPGLYLWSGDDDSPLLAHLRAEYSLEPVHDGFHRVSRVPRRALSAQARLLHCNQDIAGGSCLTLGMFTDFSRFNEQKPEAYRELLRAAGRLGHVLYLAAEAEDLRGTAIGCFSDSGVRQALKLEFTSIASLYHFSMGVPLPDSRLETSPPYPNRGAPIFQETHPTQPGHACGEAR